MQRNLSIWKKLFNFIIAYDPHTIIVYCSKERIQCEN